MKATEDIPEASRHPVPQAISSRAWILIAGLLGLATIYAVSVPGADFTVLALIGPAWLVFGSAWVVRFCVVLARRERLATLRHHWPFWAVPPLIVLLVGSLSYADLPLRTRFELSHGGLERFVQAASKEETPKERNWIGLFPVRRVEAFPNGVGFIVDSMGFFSEHGFAWSSDGESPSGDAESSFRHLSGPWYIWDISY